MSRIIVLVLFTLFSNSSYALDALKAKELNQVLGDIQKEQNIPALAVAIVDEGGLIYTKGFGRLNSEEKQPVTQHTLFRVASITKLFTAQATMQLVEENKLSLNDNVHHFLPEFKERDITISSLLTHTSGLADSKKPIDSERPFAEYISKTLINADLENSHEFIYADVNYNILGRIIEIVTGLKYTEYVEENIFSPLGLVRSGFNTGRGSMTPDVEPFLNYGFIVRAPSRAYDSSFLPSEGLITSVSELAVWAQAVLTYDKRLLSVASYKKMLTPRHKTSWGDIQIGLGWQVYHDGDSSVAQHAGSILGYKSLLQAYPDKKRAIIILTNAEEVARWDIAGAINAILDGEDYSIPKSNQNLYKTIFLLTLSSSALLLFWLLKRRRNLKVINQK